MPPLKELNLVLFDKMSEFGHGEGSGDCFRYIRRECLVHISEI
jgi:hypothetical protein